MEALRRYAEVDIQDPSRAGAAAHTALLLAFEAMGNIDVYTPYLSSSEQIAREVDDLQALADVVDLDPQMFDLRHAVDATSMLHRAAAVLRQQANVSATDYAEIALDRGWQDKKAHYFPRVCCSGLLDTAKGAQRAAEHAEHQSAIAHQALVRAVDDLAIASNLSPSQIVQAAEPGEYLWPAGVDDSQIALMNG